MQDELKPVAWMYERPWPDDMPPKEVHTEKWATDCGRYWGWTETPLYAHPPTTNPVAVSETPVGDHQMVDAVAELQLAAFLAGRGSVTSMKHGTRTAKPCPTMDDFKGMAQAALTAARAQVEGESEYRKVHEQAVIKRGEAWANHHMTSDGLIGERVTNDTASHIIRTTTEVFALAAGEHRKDAP